MWLVNVSCYKHIFCNFSLQLNLPRKCLVLSSGTTTMNCTKFAKIISTAQILMANQHQNAYLRSHKSDTSSPKRLYYFHQRDTWYYSHSLHELSAQELHSWKTWKENAGMYISVRKFLFQRRRKLLSGGELNNFLKAACCLSLVKCFKFFHFNWNFCKFLPLNIN